MKFDTSATPSELARLRPRVLAITTKHPWEKQWESLRQQLQGDPLLRELFEERYTLEFEMEKLHRTLRSGGNISLPKSYDQYKLYSFIAMIARVHKRLSPTGKHRLAGMLRNGLDDEYGLASLQHELRVSSHLMSKGFDVTYADIEGVASFDILAVKEGIELEIECKMHSADIGRKIHRRRLFQLGGRVLPILKKALEGREYGQLATITLPRRLTGHARQQEDIAACLERVLYHGISAPGPQPCTIQYNTFALDETPLYRIDPANVDRETLRQYIEDTFGFSNANMLIVGGANSVVVIVVNSLRGDSVVDSIERQLKRAVKRQFSGVRTAIMCTMLVDMTEKQLLELAKKDKTESPSSLQLMTSKLLSRPDWHYVHAVAYVASGHLISGHTRDTEVETHRIQERGISYVYYNAHHELCEDEHLKIF